MTQRSEPFPLLDHIIVSLIEEHDAHGKRRPSYLALSYATGLSESIIGRAVKRLIADGAISAPPKKPRSKRIYHQPFTTFEAIKKRDSKIRRDLVRQRADEVRRNGFTRPSATAFRKINPLDAMRRRAANYERT